MNDKSTLQIGYVARAHGLGGELGIRTFNPASEVLLDVERIRMRLKDGSELDFVVDSVRDANKELLVGLENIESRTEAERLVGSTVFVFREDISPPRPGEYFQGDLIGLRAVDVQGNPLGQIEEIWNTGPVPNLVVRAEGKPELVVPFVDEFVPEVDMAAGKVVIRPPEFME